jgi:hypothetical protein
VREAAHALKGMVGFFGAAGAVSAASRIEKAGERGELGEVGHPLSVLSRELRGIAAAMAEFAPAPADGWHLGRGEDTAAHLFSPSEV